MNTGDKIKLLREQHNYTLEELGKKVGVGKSTVRKWETGMIANMGRDKIAKLAEVFGVSPTYLISDDSKDPVKSDAGLGENGEPQFSDIQRKLVGLFPELTDSEISVLLATAQAQISSHKHQDN